MNISEGGWKSADHGIHRSRYVQNAMIGLQSLDLIQVRINRIDLPLIIAVQ